MATAKWLMSVSTASVLAAATLALGGISASAETGYNGSGTAGSGNQQAPALPQAGSSGGQGPMGDPTLPVAGLGLLLLGGGLVALRKVRRPEGPSNS